MRDLIHPGARTLVLGLLAGALAGCPFDDEIAKGEACIVNADCGPKLDCVAGICGGGSGNTQPCAYQNDGDCDEPEGTGLCPEGSDPTDCGGGGSTSSPGTSGQPPTTGSDDGNPSCTPAGDMCGADACCADATCVNFDPEGSYCAAFCSSGSECGSCCCGATTDGTGVCAFSNYCDGIQSNCPSGGGCGIGFSTCIVSSQCCDGDCLESVSGNSLCYDRCFSNSDCATGCCNDGPNGKICDATTACNGDIGDDPNQYAGRRLSTSP